MAGVGAQVEIGSRLVSSVEPVQELVHVSEWQGLGETEPVNLVGSHMHVDPSSTFHLCDLVEGPDFFRIVNQHAGIESAVPGVGAFQFGEFHLIEIRGKMWGWLKGLREGIAGVCVPEGAHDVASEVHLRRGFGDLQVVEQGCWQICWGARVGPTHESCSLGGIQGFKTRGWFHSEVAVWALLILVVLGE